MNRFKEISLFMIIFAFLQQTSYAQDFNDFDFRTYSTEEFIYTKTSQFEPLHYAAWQATPNYDEIVYSSYHSGIIRTRVTTQLENGRLMTFTETWVTKNPSYLTKTNFCRACALTLCVGGILYISQDPFATRVLFNTWLISSLLNRW